MQCPEDTNRLDDRLDWSYWAKVLGRLMPGPIERSWLKNDADLPVARGGAFLVATLCGVVTLAVGVGYAIAADAIEGIAYLVLAGLLLKGRRWAAVSLMALYTLDREFRMATAFALAAGRQGGISPWYIAADVIVWALVMRVFYVVLCSESRQRATNLSGGR